VQAEVVPDITQLCVGYRAGKVCPYVPSPAARTARLAAFARITTEDVVLDVGCGDGRVLLHLAQTVGCRCLGVDIEVRGRGPGGRRGYFHLTTPRRALSLWKCGG
jgi:SAM-dependent methyltransferase